MAQTQSDDTSSLDEDKLAEVRETFDHFDRDGNGVIDHDEFASLLEALGAGMNEQEIQAGILALDENHNGRIEFDEFAAWWGDR